MSIMRFVFDGTQSIDYHRLINELEPYLSSMRQIVYYIYIPNYLICGEISTVDDDFRNMFSVQIWESPQFGLKGRSIIPSEDVRLMYVEGFHGFFHPGNSHALCLSVSFSRTVNKLCYLINLLSRINDLKAFL